MAESVWIRTADRVYNTGARLYPSETLLAHFDFLTRVFKAHGLPLALYVDFHSFFYTHNPDAFTQLGQALHFYGVHLRYASTPQAKGKIERRHDYWQKRLPPLLADDCIHELEGANRLLDQLLLHVNQHETHRELGITPHAAKAQALAEKRSVLRPSRLVLGGRLSGASNPAFASATTAKSPPAPNVRPLRLHRAPSLFAAYARMVTAITSATPPIQKPNPLSSSMFRSSNYLSPFDRTQKSPFENYTTAVAIKLARPSKEI